MMVTGFVVAVLSYLVFPHIPGQPQRASHFSTSSCSTSGTSTSFTTAIFVRPSKATGRFLWKQGDGRVIDGFGPDGVSWRA